jgi:hypothetical protein
MRVGEHDELHDGQEEGLTIGATALLDFQRPSSRTAAP